MINKDILTNQIVVDINSLIDDIDYGLNKDAIIYELRLIKLKIRDLYKNDITLEEVVKIEEAEIKEAEIGEQEQMEEEAEAKRDELLHHQNYEASVCEI